MKKLTLWVLALVMVLSLTGCGSSEKGNNSTDSAVADKQTDAEDKTAEKPEKSETVKEEKEQQSSSVNADQTMLDAANTSVQTNMFRMVFDKDYIYFTDGYDSYRCHFDGSNVEKLEKNLDNLVVSEGKLWGYEQANVAGPGGLYSTDLSTGEMTKVVETPNNDNDIAAALVSGNWLCYTGERGTALIIRDLTTGEEKMIAHSYPVGRSGGFSDLSMCFYGDMLYALIDNSGIVNLCSYKLGSGDDEMTVLAQNLPAHGARTPIWMEEGLLLTEKRFGGEMLYYYAKYSDIGEDGKWKYTEEENKLGTVGQEYELSNEAYSRYNLGNDFVLINRNRVLYYPGFDFSAEKIVADGLSDYRGCVGKYDNAVYLFTKDSTSGSEILKISEGGDVEHIPVAIPES